MPDYTPEPGEQYPHTPEPGGAYDYTPEPGGAYAYTPEPGDLPPSPGEDGWEVFFILIFFSLVAVALAVWATWGGEAVTFRGSSCQKVLVSSVISTRGYPAVVTCTVPCDYFVCSQIVP